MLSSSIVSLAPSSRLRSWLLPSLAMFCAIAVSACDDGQSAARNDASVDLLSPPPPPDLLSPNDLTPEPVPLMPPVSGDGNVLSNVNIVTVSFKNTQWSSVAEAFGDYVPTSAWFKATGEEYGVLKATHLKKVQLDMDSPKMLHTVDFKALIKAKIADGTLPSPADHTQLLYMFYFPQGTSFTDDGGAALCVTFGGFHGTDSLNTKRYAYAVNGDCGGGDRDITNVASHELMEACTDPWINPGYRIRADQTDPWFVNQGWEVGDMCENQAGTYDNGTYVSKIWSNKAAAAGIDPCQPDGKPQYENVFAIPRDVPIVAAGAKVAFTLVGASTMLGGPWKISVTNASYSPFNATKQLATLSALTIHRYGTVRLTLTAPLEANSGDVVGVVILSGADNHPWPVAYQVE